MTEASPTSGLRRQVAVGILALAAVGAMSLTSGPVQAAAPPGVTPAAKTAGEHPLVVEKRKHFLHLAMIDRIAALAVQTSDPALKARADELRPLEKVRHRRALGRLFARLGYTGGR